MKWIGWLLVLAACRAQSVPQAAAPAVSSTVAEKPASARANLCPQSDCPACPQPDCPVRPEPEARVWHCHDLHRPHMPVSGYCRSSSRACESNRQDIVARNIGKPGPCTTQPIAHCLIVVDPITMNRQRLCARTEENCERRQRWIQRSKAEKSDNVGTCAPTINVDRFPFEDERSPVDIRAIDPDL